MESDEEQAADSEIEPNYDNSLRLWALQYMEAEWKQ